MSTQQYALVQLLERLNIPVEVLSDECLLIALPHWEAPEFPDLVSACSELGFLKVGQNFLVTPSSPYHRDLLAFASEEESGDAASEGPAPPGRVRRRPPIRVLRWTSQ